MPKNKSEPKEAFHYKPPDKAIKEKYHYIFEIDAPLEYRVPKLIFDKVIAAVILGLTFPFILIIKFKEGKHSKN